LMEAALLIGIGPHLYLLIRSVLDPRVGTKAKPKRKAHPLPKIGLFFPGSTAHNLVSTPNTRDTK